MAPGSSPRPPPKRLAEGKALLAEGDGPVRPMCRQYHRRSLVPALVARGWAREPLRPDPSMREHAKTRLSEPPRFTPRGFWAYSSQRIGPGPARFAGTEVPAHGDRIRPLGLELRTHYPGTSTEVPAPEPGQTLSPWYPIAAHLLHFPNPPFRVEQCRGIVEGGPSTAPGFGAAPAACDPMHFSQHPGEMLTPSAHLYARRYRS